MTILHISLLVIALSMAGELYRLIVGPTSWDRLLAANLIAIKSLMILTIYAYIYKLEYLLDVALLYGIIGYVGIILIANYLSDGGNDID